MSYCRFGWDGSDVYVFPSSGGIECQWCGLLNDMGSFVAHCPEEMIAHLAAHRRTGHFVPQEAIDRLWNEIPGADKPVRQEPEELTRIRNMVRDAE